MRKGALTLLLLTLAVLAFYLPEYVRRDLWEPDEARYAYIANEMRTDGHWSVPHRHGIYYAHKPPLIFWLMNAGAPLTGGEVNSVSARLPSALGVLLSLWSVFQLMRLWKKTREQAWLAVLILSSSFLFWNKGSMGQIDALLCGLELFALYLLFSSEQAKRPMLRATTAFIVMGLAVLAKGPVGVIVPLGAYAAARFAAGERRMLKRVWWLTGPVVALLPVACWLMLVHLSDPPAGYLDELIWKQNVDRAQGDLGHIRPFWYFLKYLPVDFLPWTFFVPTALITVWRSEADRPFTRRLLGWILFIVLFFSSIASKRNLYILAVYPAFAMLVAAAWPAFLEKAPHYHRNVMLVVPGLFGLGFAAAMLYPDLPISRWGALPVALSGIAGAFWIWKARQEEPLVNDQDLLRFGGSILLILWSASTFLMPAVNPLKTPVPIPEVAAQLDENALIYLYNTQGEIYALYADRKGRVIHNDEEIEAVLEETPEGLMVFEKKHWAEISPSLQERFHTREFSMGKKELLLAAWGNIPL